jgi:predicted phosphodiesterase
MGLARWRQAQQRIVASGADVVLCGHDHQEQVETLGGAVIACAGTLSTRSRGNRPSVFFRLLIEPDAIHVEQYRWDAARRVFRRSDRHQFSRRRAAVRAVEAG